MDLFILLNAHLHFTMRHLFVVVKFLQSVRFQLVEITAVPAQIRIGSQE